MTDADRREIARLIAEELRGTHQCQFADEDRATLREFAGALRKAKGAALTTLVGAVVVFVLASLGAGILTRFRIVGP